MMKTTTGLLLVLALASMPAAAQRITTDFAREFDFSSISTYTVSGIAAGDPSGQLTDDRIRHAIIRELHRAGLLTATSNPDLRVEVRLITTDRAANEATSATDVEPGPGWTGWNGAPPSPAPPTSAGTLVIDAIDTETDALVWRATSTIKTTTKPEKRHKKIDKAISKMGKRWRAILAGEGK